MKTIKTLAAALLVLGAMGTEARANGPAYDSTGNGNLNGTYYFRQVIYIVGDSSGDLSRAIAFNGSLVFDGNGNYTIPTGATVTDSGGSGAPGNTTAAYSGTYSLSASGLGYMSSPINGLYGQSDTVYFTLANGVMIASSTESGYNDLLIAASLASPIPAAGAFNGSWTMAGYLPAGTPADAEDTFFQLNPNGVGGFNGSVSVTGYIGVNGTAIQTQTSSNVKYTFSNGAAVITFPNFNATQTPFYSSQMILDFSPDGNFVFGGQNGGYDMVVGVRNGTSGASQNFTGLYFQAGLDQDLSQYISSGFANLDTYYGSFNASIPPGYTNGQGVAVAHERVNSVFYSAAYGSTFAYQYPTPAVSPYTDSYAALQYAYGSNGLYRIGAGIYPYMGLNVAVQSPALSGSGSTPYLNPQGVVNTASSSPFTAGVSNGELITLYGTNLASGTVVSPVVPLPTTLGGVQVMINGIAAPIYYVSATQVSVIVPFENAFGIASIQLNNNLGASNTITEFVYTTTAGVFTVPAGGIGYAAAVHANGTIVSPTNPAAPGETIETFLTGLGTVSPAPSPDGAAGGGASGTSVENTVSTISAEVNNLTSAVPYAGLAPTLAGLYQLNLTVPTTTGAGDQVLEVDGPDSSSAQVFITVGSASGSDRKAADEESAAAETKPSHVMDTKKILSNGHPRKQIPELALPKR